MSSAVRQLSVSARFNSRPLINIFSAAARASRCHAATPGPGRVRHAVTVAPRSESRQYWVRAGEEDLSEESKKNLDDDTRLKLGKSEYPTILLPISPPAQANNTHTAISTLKDRLPTILQQPLPTEILAPNISLHLFPSTHPHLPVANGRAAYRAALWTSPLAWNRVPIIGNVGIEVRTVRMQPGPLPFAPARIGSLDEIMVVRWVTEPESVPSEFLRNLGAQFARNGEKKPREFMGLFAFQFDGEGRILDHTIESAEHSRHWGKGVGSSVVRFTDRVLGGIRQRGDPDPLPMPACWKRGGRRE